MKYYRTWTPNTENEKVYFLIPTIIINKSYEDWTITIAWLNGGFVVELY